MGEDIYLKNDYCARKYINIKGERKKENLDGIGFYEGGEFARHEQATPMNYTTCFFYNVAFFYLKKKSKVLV
jgi:hypothetical protein